MSHPEVIYWLLVGFLAVPSSLFSRVAAVVVLVRMVAQIAWQVGLPEPQTLVVLYAIGFFASMCVADKAASFLAASLFLPLCVTAIYEVTGGLSARDAWWAIYWFAVAQTIIIPFGVEWMPVFRAIARSKMPDLFPPYERSEVHV